MCLQPDPEVARGKGASVGFSLASSFSMADIIWFSLAVALVQRLQLGPGPVSHRLGQLLPRSAPRPVRVGRLRVLDSTYLRHLDFNMV